MPNQDSPQPTQQAVPSSQPAQQPVQQEQPLYPLQQQRMGSSAHAQTQQQSVGVPTNSDGPSDGHTSHAPLSRSNIVDDPTKPPTVPFQKPKSQPVNLPDAKKEQIAQELPPSKLLHSNPEPEPRNPNLLENTDSETHEVEEFYDAQSLEVRHGSAGLFMLPEYTVVSLWPTLRTIDIYQRLRSARLS